MIDGPVHRDECGHGADCYVGSFEHVSRPRDSVVRYDVYVFENASMGTEVCIRYGDYGSEYLSPGQLYSFIQASAQSERYRKALELIRAAGVITWRRKTETT